MSTSEQLDNEAVGTLYRGAILFFSFSFFEEIYLKIKYVKIWFKQLENECVGALYRDILFHHRTLSSSL